MKTAANAAAASGETGNPARLTYDVFHGGADGICALHQLRLATPRDAVLVSGALGEDALLDKVACGSGIEVTVLNVPADANARALRGLLDAGAQVEYFDHRAVQQAIEHARFRHFRADLPAACTSLLVDRHVRGRFREWAVAAAFGIDLPATAMQIGKSMGLGESSMQALEELGRMLEYNACGDSIDDLHFSPCDLYRSLHPFADPFEFIEDAPQYRALCEGYREDAVRMQGLTPCWTYGHGAVYILPAEPWARRIAGIFADRLAASGDTRSYAVLVETARGTYKAGIRSGQPAQRGADGLCMQFPSGGGGKSAAGIDCLPAAELDNFIRAFAEYFGSQAVVAPPGQSIHPGSGIARW